MKEILVYSDIWSWPASQFIKELEQAKGQPVTIRINTPGGEPEYGWGMVAKLAEHTGTKTMKVDGKADSWGSFMLLYGTSSSALDVSVFLLHRAAYPSWFEADKNYMTEAHWQRLNLINGKLREAAEARLDLEAFKRITGKTMDDLFSNDSRIDVQLTAEQAKEIGLINEIVQITPAKRKEINALYTSVAASFGREVSLPFPEDTPTPTPTTTTTQTTPHKMEATTVLTLAALKAEHANAYKAAVDEERDRVTALLAFLDIDSEAVVKAIKEGTGITETFKSEMMVKALSKQRLTALEEDSAGVVTPGETPTAGAPTAEEKLANDVFDRIGNNIKGSWGK